MQAAETVGSAVIGVDADRSSESETVLTSAVKGFSTSVYDTLADIDSGEFEGGRNVMFDAASNGVGLTIDTAHFKHFTQGDYDAVFTRLQTDADGHLLVSCQYCDGDRTRFGFRHCDNGRRGGRSGMTVLRQLR